MRVLVIDDDPDVRDITAELLSDAGHEVRTALNATDALTVAREGEYDVIVLDFNLPDMSGAEVTRVLRERGDTTDIIMMSGSTEMDAAVQELASLNVRQWLYKPHVVGELAGELARLALVISDKKNE